MKSAKRLELEQRARQLGYELEWTGSCWGLIRWRLKLGKPGRLLFIDEELCAEIRAFLDTV